MRLLLVALIATVFSCVTASTGTSHSFHYEGRTNLLWIPAKATANHTHTTHKFPLFVMLHGCNQTTSDFAVGSKMTTYCDTYDCFVLFPEQPLIANPEQCWNWFKPGSQMRGGSGEPAIIVQMAQSLFNTYAIDQTRVFVGGMSAGGAMAVILGATYPDFFRAIAVGSGMEFQAATSELDSHTAQVSGGPNPTTNALLAYQAAQGNNREIVVLVVHGTDDNIAAPINGHQVAMQYVSTLNLVLGSGVSRGLISSSPTHQTSNPPQVAGGHSYTTYEYAEKTHGKILVTHVLVNGMRHAWSGGDAAGSFTDPKGPDASLMMINMFYNWTASN